MPRKVVRKAVKTMPVVEFNEPFMIAGVKVPAVIARYTVVEDPDSMEIKIDGFNRVSKRV